MKLTIKLMVFVMTLILAGTTFANSLCPKIKFIKAEGLSGITGEDGLYFAYHMSTYKTDANWGFTLGPFNASSEKEALKTASKILNNMIAPGVLDKNGACYYDTGYPEFEAMAFINTSIVSMKNHMKKI